MLSLFVVALGCAGERPGAKVSGTISYEGKLITQGTVLFMPRGGITSTGKIEADGSFKLLTPGKDESIPLGEYTVFIITDESSMAQQSEDPMALATLKPKIPLKFSSSATSPLRYQVVEGENVFHINLDDLP